MNFIVKVEQTRPRPNPLEMHPNAIQCNLFHQGRGVSGLSHVSLYRRTHLLRTARVTEEGELPIVEDVYGLNLEFCKSQLQLRSS